MSCPDDAIVGSVVHVMDRTRSNPVENSKMGMIRKVCDPWIGLFQGQR